eukprot:COSAG02_NODE_33898_length_492_cov_1.417303_1_plen_94_part_01
MSIQLGKVIRIRLIRQMAHKTVIRHILETHSGLIRGCSRYVVVFYMSALSCLKIDIITRSPRYTYGPAGRRTRSRRHALLLAPATQHDLKCDSA